MKGELVIDVARPRADVFDRLASPETLVQGVAEVTSLRRASGKGGKGTTYDVTVKAGRRSEEATARVVDHVEPSRIGYEIEAKPGTVTLDLRLEPGRGRGTTTIRCAYEVKVAGIARFVAGPLLKGWVARNEDGIRERVRAVLEGPAPKRSRGR